MPRHRPSLAALGAAIALIVVAAIAVPVIVWAGARSAGRDDNPRPGALADEPGVSHVHGLGINPADGSLIVATHYGSFRIPAGGDDAERIGESFQDTMGFTVAGADHFLGSGHPAVSPMGSAPPWGSWPAPSSSSALPGASASPTSTSKLRSPGRSSPPSSAPGRGHHLWPLLGVVHLVDASRAPKTAQFECCT